MTEEEIEGYVVRQTDRRDGTRGREEGDTPSSLLFFSLLVVVLSVCVYESLGCVKTDVASTAYHFFLLCLTE